MRALSNTFDSWLDTRKLALLERYALGYSWHRAAQICDIPARTYHEWLASQWGGELRAMGERMRSEVIASAQPQYAAVVEKAQAILLRVGDEPGELDPDSRLVRWAERTLNRTLWPALLIRAMGASGLGATTGAAISGIHKLLKDGEPAQPDIP